MTPPVNRLFQGQLTVRERLAAAAMEYLPAGSRVLVDDEKRMSPNAFYDR
jgi:hypothetical protein